MRLPHEWFDEALPTNISLAPTAFLHSSYAFNNYRSESQPGLRIGDHTFVLDATMFDLGPTGEVMIGNYCVINSTHFIGNSRIVIGDFVFASSEVFISDSAIARPPSDGDPRGREGPAIIIGDDCWLGMRSVLLDGADLGQGTIVGAGAVVDFAVPAWSVVAGNPARVVGTAPPSAHPLPSPPPS
jgi:acetyltransferase-like isoleucine patch superfamily enzyme